MADYVLLFAVAFIAASILPAPSELPLALLAARDGIAAPVTVATAGNVLGACTTFALARLAVRRWTATTPGQRRAQALVARHGGPALLLSWVPVIGDALVAVAGAAGLPAGRFLVWTTLGKLARYWVVARLAAG